MIVLKNLKLRRGAKLVLDGVNVALNPGEKIGLVGRNGAGKTSLFGLLTGQLHADTGDFEMPPRWRLAEVEQTMPETEQGATDFVLEGDAPLMQAQAALAVAERDDDGHAMAEAHQQLADAGAFDARARAEALSMGLGFSSGQLDSPVNRFSGGWRMRLQLARALMCPADLMLLDEPTNHLDLDALVWLESWLQRYAGTLIVISHDREFLDAVTKVTLHLDLTQLTRYTGNYSAFEEMRAERLSQREAAYGRQQEKIATLTRFIERFRAKATKARQAQSRVKALARMERIAPVLTAADFNFEFREPLNLPDPMLALDGVACGYGDRIVVGGISRSVAAGQRIGILGANGQGKSTFVKTIARELPALAGRITEGKGLAIGYFAQQELDVLRLGEGPLDHMLRLAREAGPAAREQELRDFLGNFRFTGEMARQPAGTLSGGEKARLVLAMLVWQRPNLLLLDEPTNHLDLETREALSMALNEYEGTVLLVSHDRALLREVCDEFWLVARGKLEPFDGDLDDYQRWLLEQSRAVARAARGEAGTKTTTEPNPPRSKQDAPSPERNPPRDERKARAKAAERTRPLRAELQQIEARLERIGDERKQLEGALAAADLASADIADAGRQLNHIGAETAALEERWLALTGEIEAMTAG